MSLIQLRNLHKTYGSLVIFEDESADLAAGDRIGVIGRNGAGKSTLLKIILGEEELDGGHVVRTSRLRLSSLQQHSPFEAGESVLDFLMRSSSREAWRCGKVAGRFQIGNDILEATAESLPGGFQTRVKIVSMLLDEPNFLLLDEPTNYLDLRTLLLLERFLNDFKGGYLVVSHDREFLKRTCTKTLEIERGTIVLFPGGIEEYLRFKEEREEQARRFNRNVEAQRRHLQGFVDRYRVRASTASRAQSKLKQMERLRTIEIGHPMSTARIRIPPVEEKKGVALSCADLAIGYPENEVARGIRFEIERGRHVAVLGDNGQGKTTLLRTLAGDLEPRRGSFRWGHNLSAGYYAQHVYRALQEDLDVFSYLARCAARDILEQEILDLAGSFLFGGADVEKPIRVLSGGERARVCLAGLLLARHPVLLLDEPTNHLDFETVEALGRALREYRGTIFFVSHDRTFVNLVATSILEVRDGAVTLFPGDYELYVSRAQEEVDRDLAGGDAAPREADTQAAARPAGKTNHYALRKERRSRMNRLRTRIARLEERIAGREREREEISRFFLDHPTAFDPERQARAGELHRLLAEDEELWLSLQEELEELARLDGRQGET